jgi:hypothetical protein
VFRGRSATLTGYAFGVTYTVARFGDSIWAAGKICYRKDDNLASGLGVRFMAMATSQARLIRDFCIEMRRKHLGSMLARIRA